jgi:hypothetical protein
MPMSCNSCGGEIPPIRLEIFPDTQCCASCSTTPKNRVFMMYSHKTAGEIVAVNGADTEALRIAEREYRRCR